MIAVFMQYGRTMLAVQIWEAQLATLVLAAEIKEPHRQRSGDPWRRFRKQFKKTLHQYTKASASELCRGLPEPLRDELREDLDNAVKARDRLAHRYLREQMRVTQTSWFKRGTLRQLEEWADGFTRFADRLKDEYERLMADWPRGDMPAGLEAALRDVSLLILQNEPLPKRRQDS